MFQKLKRSGETRRQIDKHVPFITNMPEIEEEDVEEVSEERKEARERCREMIEEDPEAFEYLAER